MSADDLLGRCRRIASDRLPASGGGLRAGDAALYLAHVVHGAALRGLARAAGRTPSTILRAVRRVELKRDDPLLDSLLAELEAVARDPGAPAPLAMESALPQSSLAKAVRRAPEADARRLEKEARRILRRLSEPRAFLALAQGAEVACVFRKAEEALVTLARTPVDMARGFAARDWIGCVHSGGGMARYEITEAGRAWLKRTLAEDGEARRRAAETAPGLAEAPSPFARQHQIEGERAFAGPDGVERRRVNLGETPLGWLARRKGPDGGPFLRPEELAAGERLREDFELAQLGPRVTQDWRSFLAPAGPGRSGPGRGPAEGPRAARERVTAALEALGPGLDDAALRACCFLEGLEATERRMGWSARSGKVVLKIALQRLAQHYGYAAASRPAARGGEAAA
jgi:hypothetical protein